MEDLKNEIAEKVEQKTELKELEIDERKKESELKDQLFEDKQKLCNLKDVVSKKAEEVSDLTHFISKMELDKESMLMKEADITSQLEEVKSRQHQFSSQFIPEDQVSDVSRGSNESNEYDKIDNEISNFVERLIEREGEDAAFPIKKLGYGEYHFGKRLVHCGFIEGSNELKVQVTGGHVGLEDFYIDQI